MQNFSGGGPSGLDMWLMTNSKNFPPEQIPFLQQRLAHIPESHFNAIYALQMKEPITILLLSIFLGGFGVDRFFLGDIGLGVGKLLTLGGCGLWALIDIFFVMGRAREVNFQEVMKLLAHFGL
jgi:TM2 domain-containing membrane protein YozV